MCAPIPKNKWAWKFDKCVKCETKKKFGKYIHKGRGLCMACHDKERAKNPKRAENLKRQKQRYYERFLKLPNYKELQAKRQKEWQLKYANHYKALWHRNGLKLKFIRFIKSSVQHKYKKYKKSLSYYCEDCQKNIKTPIIARKEVDSELRGKGTIGRELIYFKKVHDKLFHLLEETKSDWIKL